MGIAQDKINAHNIHHSKDIVVRMIDITFDKSIVEMKFIEDETKKEIVEALDLTIDHEKVRFSMFLESFQIKTLTRFADLIAIFIKEEIEIKMRVRKDYTILYSHALEKDQKNEFKKHEYLLKMLNRKRITKDTYEEMKDMTYKEVRAMFK